MKKLAILSILFIVFIACKKEDPPTTIPSSVDMNARLHGIWDITAVTYSGLAPNPLDSTQQIPFSGEGSQVTGYYDFDTIPDPNRLDFEMAFVGALNFASGTTLNVPVNEEGWGLWYVVKEKNTIEGTSYVINSTETDTVPVVWDILENEPTRQVWATTREFDWPGFPVPVLLDMKTTIEKQ